MTRVAGYAAAKAGISNFTQYMAHEVALKFGEGIRVNAIAPGFFITEQNRNLLTNPDGTYTDADRARARGLVLGHQQADGMSRLSGWLTPEARATWLQCMSGLLQASNGAP